MEVHKKRPRKLLATNDIYIDQLLVDPHYDVREDGTIWASRVTAEYPTGTWREIGRSTTNAIRITYKRCDLRAHRIVYRKFIGPLSDDLVINHKDGNCRNNHPTNLEQTHSRKSASRRVHKLGRAPLLGYKEITPQIAESIRVDQMLGLTGSQLREKYRLPKSLTP